MGWRVTKKDLEEMTAQLNAKEDRPSRPSTRDEAGHYKANPGHIVLDHAACYGGYALREITNERGGEGFYYPSWTRVSAREMYNFLLGKLNS
jgi:hypothetical protein